MVGIKDVTTAFEVALVERNHLRKSLAKAIDELVALKSGAYVQQLEAELLEAKKRLREFER